MGGPRRLEYQPALEGVRALAVVAVLLFHAGTPGFGGGYLGVSVFFTLSGYLITSLLLVEHDTTGSVDYRRFYGRRLRRLFPASAATIAAVVIVAAVTDVFDGVTDLRAQVVGALLQVSNWVLLAGDSSYQDLLAQASGSLSPLEHFWSLAIEEQFYWLWPAMLAPLLARFAGHRARVVVIAALTMTAMIAAPVIAQVWGPDAAYWATPARLAEILVGALLAVVLRAATLPRRTSVLAPVAVVALMVAVVTFPSSSGPAYEGWLSVVAVVSGALILGLQTDGPVKHALSFAPIVALGRISYGVYLVHWPVFVIADADRIGVDGAPLTLLRLTITLAIAVASYRLIEQPIRTRQEIPFRATLSVAAATTVALVGVALLVVPTGPSNYWNADPDDIAAAAIDPDPDAGALVVSPTTPATATTAATPTTDGSSGPGTGSTAPATTTTTLAPLPELARPVRIVVTGDSTADALGTGVVGWAAEHPDLAQVSVQAALGCGFVMGGDRLLGDEILSMASCDGWPEAQLFPVVERSRPDVVAVMVSAWDLADRRWDDGELLRPDDPEYRERLLDTYTGLVDDLIAAGASRVAFVREPVPNVWWGGTVTDEDDPGRHAVLAEVQAEVASARPEHVRVIEFASWFTDAGFEFDRDVRPDGIHLAPEPAMAITDAYLGEQLMRAALL